MTNQDLYLKLEKMYKRLYMLTEQLAEYALHANADQAGLKQLHYKDYNLKDEAFRSWLEIKKHAEKS